LAFDAIRVHFKPGHTGFQDTGVAVLFQLTRRPLRDGEFEVLLEYALKEMHAEPWYMLSHALRILGKGRELPELLAHIEHLLTGGMEAGGAGEMAMQTSLSHTVFALHALNPDITEVFRVVRKMEGLSKHHDGAVRSYHHACLKTHMLSGEYTAREFNAAIEYLVGYSTRMTDMTLNTLPRTGTVNSRSALIGAWSACQDPQALASLESLRDTSASQSLKDFCAAAILEWKNVCDQLASGTLKRPGWPDPKQSDD